MRPARVNSTVHIEESTFDGEPALELSAGRLRATVLPDVGMTGVSLRRVDDEFFAVPNGLPGLRSGSTGGLPLLAPWANRLSSASFRAAGVDVDLGGFDVHSDGNGLPIHGLLVGASGWRIDETATTRDAARVDASFDLDSPAFPFPHRIQLRMELTDDRLTVTTTVVPTGSRPVPVSFGWHPYLTLPRERRHDWTLHLPACDHLELDPMGIPTGVTTAQTAESAPIDDRTFDDLYRLGSDYRLGLGAATASIELHCEGGYDYAQVWVPSDRPFAALEPMVAATNALVAGSAPVVDPGDAFTARFSLVIS